MGIGFWIIAIALTLFIVVEIVAIVVMIVAIPIIVILTIEKIVKIIKTIINKVIEIHTNYQYVKELNKKLEEFKKQPVEPIHYTPSALFPNKEIEDDALKRMKGKKYGRNRDR